MAKEGKVFEILQQYTKKSLVDLGWIKDSDLGIYFVNTDHCPTIFLGELLKNDPKQASKVLSHELGHYYLHRGKLDVKKYKHGRDQRDENYVNLLRLKLMHLGPVLELQYVLNGVICSEGRPLPRINNLTLEVLNLNLTVNDIPDIEPEHIETFKALAEYADLLIKYDNKTILKEKNRLLKKYPELDNDSFHRFFDTVLQAT